MEYVEILRARRVLFWYGIVLLGLVLITALSVFGGHADIQRGNSDTKFSSVLAGAMFGAFVVATFIATGLNAESATTAIIWTRPTARDTIAWRYVAVDAAAIAVGYAMIVVAILAVMAVIGVLDKVVYDVLFSLPVAALGLGAALMCYALVSLAAARLPGRGGLIAGLSWAVFLVAVGVRAAPLPSLLHGIIVALDYLNPLAYVGGTHSDSGVPLDLPVRIAMVWAIAAVAAVASVRLWSTREV